MEADGRSSDDDKPVMELILKRKRTNSNENKLVTMNEFGDFGDFAGAAPAPNNDNSNYNNNNNYNNFSNSRPFDQGLAFTKIPICGVMICRSNVGNPQLASKFQCCSRLLSDSCTFYCMISGPYYDIDQARVACSAAFDNKFSLILDDNIRGTEHHSFRKILRCKHYNCRNAQCTKPCKCLFKLVFEICLDDKADYCFMLYDADTNHNGHAFVSSPTKALADPQNRDIPQKYHLMLQAMADAGSGYRQMHTVLNKLNESDGFKVTWTIDDLRRVFPRDSLRDPYDASKVIEMLLQLKDEGLFSDYVEDVDGKLDLIFAEVKGGRECIEKMSMGPGGSKHTFVMFDTTFGTNPYGCKLGMFVQANQNGRTTILAVSIISKEEDSYNLKWIFNSFQSCYGHVDVIMTDSCSKIEKGLRESNLSQSTHLYCIYHVGLNFVEHIASLPQEIKKKMLQSFWSMAKNTDKSSCDTFDYEFASMVAIVTDSPTIPQPHSPAINKLIHWLNDTQ